MANWTIGGAAILALLAVIAGARATAARLPVDDPAALARTRSLGDLIQQTIDRPVHIVFVHGMRAEGIGTAQTLMAGLCKYGPVKCATSDNFQSVERRPLPIGDWPQSASMMGVPIWASDKDWQASKPFVDRYVFTRGEGSHPVIVDEVNWWPLLVPLKCRALVAPEARLSGADKAHLKLCMRNDAPYHPWLTQAEYDSALMGPVISGGGALANRYVKQQIVNWGLSDAAIALGPMRRLFRRTIDEAFAYAGAYDGHDETSQEFAVVSESLGSFVVLDAAANVHNDSPKAQAVVGRTSDLYFFANQFALLELARIKGLAKPRGDTEAGLAFTPAEPEEPSPTALLKTWAKSAPNNFAPARPKQIVAFNDPSDVLTFDVPAIPEESAIVVNVYDRNEFDWFGLLADPLKAHTGHSSNPQVLRMIFTPANGRQDLGATR